MKLNKNGWGLREMIFFSSILFIFLFIAIYYISRMYDTVNQNLSATNYIELEKKLEDQTLIYLDKYYDGYLTSDNMIINESILKSYNLNVDLRDNKGKICTGYVIANKTHGIIHKKAYIKCPKYQTEGYTE